MPKPKYQDLPLFQLGYLPAGNSIAYFKNLLKSVDGRKVKDEDFATEVLASLVAMSGYPKFRVHMEEAKFSPAQSKIINQIIKDTMPQLLYRETGQGVYSVRPLPEDVMVRTKGTSTLNVRVEGHHVRFGTPDDIVPELVGTVAGRRALRVELVGLAECFQCLLDGKPMPPRWQTVDQLGITQIKAEALQLAEDFYRYIVLSIPKRGWLMACSAKPYSDHLPHKTNITLYLPDPTDQIPDFVANIIRFFIISKGLQIGHFIPAMHVSVSNSDFYSILDGIPLDQIRMKLNSTNAATQVA